jgi:hypothetical protein
MDLKEHHDEIVGTRRVPDADAREGCFLSGSERQGMRRIEL